MANPVIANSTSNDSGGSTVGSLQLTKPSGVVADDALLLVVGDDEAGTPSYDALSGWTLEVSGGDATSDCTFAVYSRVATGSDNATETVSWSHGSNEAWGKYLLITGADATTPIDTIGTVTIVASANNISISEITPIAADCLILAVAAFDGGDAPPLTTGSAGGWVEFAEGQSGSAGNDASGSISQKDNTTGATGVCGVSSGTSDGWAGVQIAIAPGGAAAFTLAAAAAAYSWTGTAANLEYHSVLSAAAAAYTWTGQVAALSIGYTLAVESASYTWTGQAAGLEYHTVLSAEAAAYSWTGQAANLELHSILSVDPAAYTWTGQTATLTVGLTLAADSAAYAWTGQTATLIFDAMLAAEAEAYVWTGQAATLTYLTGFVLDVEPAAWTWTGSEVGFLYDRIMAADAAGYTWTGTAATLTYAVVVGGPVDNYAGFMVNVGGMGRR